jgi:hypothetical protein
MLRFNSRILLANALKDYLFNISCALMRKNIPEQLLINLLKVAKDITGSLKVIPGDKEAKTMNNVTNRLSNISEQLWMIYPNKYHSQAEDFSDFTALEASLQSFENN